VSEAVDSEVRNRIGPLSFEGAFFKIRDFAAFAVSLILPEVVKCNSYVGDGLGRVVNRLDCRVANVTRGPSYSFFDLHAYYRRSPVGVDYRLVNGLVDGFRGFFRVHRKNLSSIEGSLSHDLAHSPCGNSSRNPSPLRISLRCGTGEQQRGDSYN